MIVPFGFPPGATPLDRNEADGLKHKHVTTREQLDELEQANIVSGLRWLSRHRGDVLTDRFVVALHKRLFGEVWAWAGTFRRTGKNIGIDPIHIEVELRAAMDDARYWVEHETYGGVEVAVRMHHRLAYIHPFPNGNGRLARVAADAVLRKIFRATPIDWAGGYDPRQMEGRRSAYIAALRAADGGDFEPLLRFVGGPGGSA